MKAKYFKKIRGKVKYYDVQVTQNLFGSFWNPRAYDVVKVLALSPLNAVDRAKKRGLFLTHTHGRNATSQQWGKFKVREHGKPDNHRFITYF